jgi:hypothetical protein
MVEGAAGVNWREPGRSDLCPLAETSEHRLPKDRTDDICACSHLLHRHTPEHVYGRVIHTALLKANKRNAGFSSPGQRTSHLFPITGIIQASSAGLRDSGTSSVASDCEYARHLDLGSGVVSVGSSPCRFCCLWSHPGRHSPGAVNRSHSSTEVACFSSEDRGCPYGPSGCIFCSSMLCLKKNACSACESSFCLPAGRGYLW